MALAGSVLLAIGLGFILWKPGLDIRDGRHDRGRNGLWLGHGWLGGDDWFIRYPPPTWWRPFEDVHWDESYFRKVAHHADQMAVMMYDAAQRIPRTYQRLMADWTQEVLAWSGDKPVLLGVPTYDDAGSGYHDPKVENLTNALLGVHRGLSRRPLPNNYQGVAITASGKPAMQSGFIFGTTLPMDPTRANENYS